VILKQNQKSIRDTPRYANRWFHQGRLVIDRASSQFLWDYAELPSLVSSEVELWLLEAWQRVHIAISIDQDVKPRMYFVWNAGTGGYERPGKRNTLGMRLKRLREDVGSLAWTKRGNYQAHQDRYFDIVGLACKQANSIQSRGRWFTEEETRYLRDLLKGASVDSFSDTDTQPGATTASKSRDNTMAQKGAVGENWDEDVAPTNYESSRDSSAPLLSMDPRSARIQAFTPLFERTQVIGSARNQALLTAQVEVVGAEDISRFHTCTIPGQILWSSVSAYSHTNMASAHVSSNSLYPQLDPSLPFRQAASTSPYYSRPPSHGHGSLGRTAYRLHTSGHDQTLGPSKYVEDS
jgi:hypothetical protein